MFEGNKAGKSSEIPREVWRFPWGRMFMQVFYCVLKVGYLKHLALVLVNRTNIQTAKPMECHCPHKQRSHTCPCIQPFIRCCLPFNPFLFCNLCIHFLWFPIFLLHIDFLSLLSNSSQKALCGCCRSHTITAIINHIAILAVQFNRRPPYR